MIRIKNVSLPVDHTASVLYQAVAKKLSLPSEAIADVELVRRSLDARRRDSILYVYTVDVRVDDDIKLSVDAIENSDVSETPDAAYRFHVNPSHVHVTRPIIVGAGPCGLFAALLLARCGFRPIILERGRPVRERMRDVRAFWRDGVLNPQSNVLFGEGGAGTFSDGKLNTQVKDRENRRLWILREFVKAGAPPEIQYENKAHIGTNNLIKVIENLRSAITTLGGEIRYDSQVTGLITKSDSLQGVVINNTDEMNAENILLAIGHSARDTFNMIYESGVALEQKAFSIGARIEHPQTLIDAAMYGVHSDNPALGAADYKAVWHCKNGRSVYTFCMCPGGHVIATCNEPGGIATNGMSFFARKGKNANSGLLVGVEPRDYGDSHPLAGIAFQRRWEQAAYRLGGGNYRAPIQLVGDLLAAKPSTGLGDVQPSYKPGVTFSDLRKCLPDYVIEAWREAIPEIGKKIRGFDLPEAVLTGVESRSSSPVRIVRTANCQSISLQGLFPAGEGAGYAGGIMSAAIDGMRAAEQLALRITAQKR